MRPPPGLLITLAALIAAPASGQLLPPVGEIVRPVERALEPLRGRIDEVASVGADLARLRIERLAKLLRSHGDLIELDAAGQPARRGELLLVGASTQELDLALAAGFTPLASEDLDELGLSLVRLGVPEGVPLAQADKILRGILPDATITSDQLHFTSGAVQSGKAVTPRPAAAPINTPVGMIDGAPGSAVAIERIEGFARGAPAPSHHGSAVASLLSHAGVSRIAVADVYGTDPAGGGALAIVRGMDWLLGAGVRVVSMSLVGPNNPLVERAISAARRKGIVVVAAVGNDGPAAPPSYPASYPGVLAVTAVDGRNRPLIEAGRALHLDYAAPGGDIAAANASGKWVKVRGTSYAVPLVAARAAAAVDRGVPHAVAALDREAVDLGPKGPDRSYGRGLLCGSCRPRR